MIWFLIAGLGDASSLKSAEGIGAIIQKAGRTLFFSINELIYSFIANLYQVFEYLCNARLLDSEQIQILATRVGLILGIIMLFRVMFNFIQMLLEPDKMTDKETGAVAIIKKILVVIVLLGISNYVFDMTFYAQRFVIKEKIIYKLILPEEKNIDTKNFGTVLSARIFGTFYNVNESLLALNVDEATQCVSYRNMLINNIALDNNFNGGMHCLLAYADNIEIKNNPTEENSETTNINAFIMDYNYIFQTIIGIFLVYILVSYVVKVGVRVVQLTVLQIISPMAIISYLSPKKDNMFNKWWKIYFATYIDAFIRMAIIYFVIYLSCIILDTWETGTSVFWTSIGSPDDGYTKSLFAIAMILALLTFAKKAPDLIKELLPASASKLGFGASMKDIVGLQKGINTVAAAGTGAAIGLIGGVAGGKGWSKLTGAVGGVLGGALRGGHAGFGSKNVTGAVTSARSKQAKANITRAQRIASGADLEERVSDAARDFFGMQSGYEGVDRQLSIYNNLNSLINDEDIVKDYVEQRAEANKNVTEAQANFDRTGSVADRIKLENAQRAYRNADARVSAAKEAVFHAARTGTTVRQLTFDYIDSTGTLVHGYTENTALDIGPNASIATAIDNVERISRKKYTTRKAFNDDRKALSNAKLQRTSRK